MCEVVKFPFERLGNMTISDMTTSFPPPSLHEGVGKCTEKPLQLFPCQAWRRSSWVKFFLMCKVPSNSAYFQSHSNSAPFQFSGMCIPNFYKPLIFSRQSHSQESATQRCSLNLVSKVLQVLGHGGTGVLVVLVRLLGGGVPLLLHDTKGQCSSQV